MIQVSKDASKRTLMTHCVNWTNKLILQQFTIFKSFMLSFSLYKKLRTKSA